MKENTTYLEALVDAIHFTYKESLQSQNYFGITNGRERSMVFRIAHHLAEDIEKHGAFVDIEPTRCEGRVKRKPQTKRDSEGNPIIPDLIIHKRIDTGFVAVEFKCYRNKREWQKDFDKLKCLTVPKKLRENNNSSTPHYELGVFVYLTNNKDDIQIRIYENGEIVTEKYPYSKILKGFKYA